MADLDTISGRELDALVAERIMGWTRDAIRRDHVARAVPQKII